MPSLDRDISVCGKDRVVKHTWQKHPRGYSLTSVLLKVGSKRPAGSGVGPTVVDDESGLDLAGREHAETLKTRAEQRTRKAPAAAAAAAPPAKRRLGADAALSRSSPLATAITTGSKRAGRASEAEQPRVQTAEEKHRADVVEMVEKDPVLAEEIREVLRESEQEQRRVDAVNAENTRSLAASLASLQLNCKSETGRIAYNTALAVAAGAGEHTCSPDDPCDPAARCPPAQPASGVNLTERAASLGVRDKTFREARARMHHVDHSLAPSEAVEQGRYCWAERKTRCDKTDTRVLDLAYRFWHSDDVSRGCGDSGTKNMWRPSKQTGEAYHSKRQLMVSGDEVFHKFLRWPQYLALRADLLQEDSTFQDPGRTTFLSTRCGCLVEPEVSQCACQIHTQQSQYLDALEFLMGGVHGRDCDCACDWCDGAGCQKWTGMCKNLHSFSEALACAKVNLLEGDPSGGVEHWARKPACTAGSCDECGFGNPNGIPTDCQAFEKHSHRLVGWLRFEDQTMEDGTVHKKQQIPQTGSLGTLWKEFMAHSLLYMEHHELAKWQHQAHNTSMMTFLHKNK
ncbi:unnamed protein product [Pylaiella littoralis]